MCPILWGSVSPFQTCQGCSDVSRHPCGSRRLRFQFSNLPSIPRGSPRPMGTARWGCHPQNPERILCLHEGSCGPPHVALSLHIWFQFSKFLCTFCCHNEIKSSSCELRVKRASENLKRKKKQAWSCSKCPPEPPQDVGFTWARRAMGPGWSGLPP